MPEVKVASLVCCAGIRESGKMVSDDPLSLGEISKSKASRTSKAEKTAMDDQSKIFEMRDFIRSLKQDLWCEWAQLCPLPCKTLVCKNKNM